MRPLSTIRRSIAFTAVLAGSLVADSTFGQELRRYAAPRIEVLSSAEAWKRLPPAETGAGEPLPAWACAFAQTLPQTTAAMLELDYLVRTTPQFSPLERGLIRLAAARVNHSDYGGNYAELELFQAGLDDTARVDLAHGKTSMLSEPHRLLFEFAAQLARAGREITDEQYRALNAHYDDEKMVGIVLLTAYASFQDRLVHALSLPVGEDNPDKPLEVRFTDSTPGGSLTKPAERPPIPLTVAAEVRRPDWTDFSFAQLQSRLEAQRAREPRIHVPDWDEMFPRLPKGLYHPDRPLRIRWSRLVVGNQPQIGPAWIKCLRVFGRESGQNRAFEESVFWVVTRELRCFYCMGHCEMLMEVGGLKPDEIAVRTRNMAEGDWSEFTPAERAAYSLAAILTHAPWTVTDADLALLISALGQERALDAVWWIARCQFMTKVSDAFQLSLERENVFKDFEPPKESPKSE